MAQLVVLRNPFERRDRDIIALPEGDRTVAALVGEYIPAGVDVNVSINGLILARDAWPTYTLAPCDEMVVVPRVAGKDFNPLAAILMIAVMVAAPWAATYVLGGSMTAAGVAATMGTMGGMALSAGFGLVGAMAVGSLIDAGIDAKADLAISQNLHQLEGGA